MWERIWNAENHEDDYVPNSLATIDLQLRCTLILKETIEHYRQVTSISKNLLLHFPDASFLGMTNQREMT
jgi:hypothetical protein